MQHPGDLGPVLWGLWEGTAASSPPKTGLFCQLVRMKAFKRSMPQLHMLMGDTLHLVFDYLDNLSDSSLIPLALGFPPEIAHGLSLSVFSFFPHETMKLTGILFKELQKIRVIHVCSCMIVLQCKNFLDAVRYDFYSVCQTTISLRFAIILR